MTKAVYDELTANILSAGKLKAFPLQPGKRQRYPLSPLLLNIVLEVSATAIRDKKKKKLKDINAIQIG